MTEFKGFLIPTSEIICTKEMTRLEKGCGHITCSQCIFGNYTEEQMLAGTEYIARYMTPITQTYVELGLLGEEKQEELSKANNSNGNLQCFDGYVWNNVRSPIWNKGLTYRLDPDYKSEEQKKAERTAELIKELESLGAVIDGKIIKGV